MTIEPVAIGHAINPGFVGLSMEYPAVQADAGSDARALDPVFEQLIRNLAPGQRPVLRIGGNTTDWTWRAIPHTPRPRWVRFQLTNQWIMVARALAQALDARVIPSLNLEADSPEVAATEVRALRRIGGRRLEAFEIGNEPELYPSFSWYRRPDGIPVAGRPRGYDFAAFTRDYSRIASALEHVRLAGPSTGSLDWSRPLPEFMAAEPRLAVVTLHRYGLDRCEASDPAPTIARLLSPPAERSVADSVVAAVQVAHAHRLPLRIEELNAVSCGGQPGVSDTFASALWALDTLFEAARVGVDGVNIHTRSQGVNSLFATRLVRGRWLAAVHPEYYGLMLFAQTAPPGARLLRVAGTAGPQMHVWATRANGRTRVIVINQDLSHARTVTLRLPPHSGSATSETLRAPYPQATADVTLGGRSFASPSATGLLTGTRDEARISPARGLYAVTLPAGTAVLLTMG